MVQFIILFEQFIEGLGDGYIIIIIRVQGCRSYEVVRRRCEQREREVVAVLMQKQTACFCSLRPGKKENGCPGSDVKGTCLHDLGTNVLSRGLC